MLWSVGSGRPSSEGCRVLLFDLAFWEAKTTKRRSCTNKTRVKKVLGGYWYSNVLEPLSCVLFAVVWSAFGQMGTRCGFFFVEVSRRTPKRPKTKGGMRKDFVIVPLETIFFQDELRCPSTNRMTSSPNKNRSQQATNLDM